jgi:hypothetical protein
MKNSGDYVHLFEHHLEPSRVFWRVRSLVGWIWGRMRNLTFVGRLAARVSALRSMRRFQNIILYMIAPHLEHYCTTVVPVRPFRASSSSSSRAITALSPPRSTN